MAKIRSFILSQFSKYFFLIFLPFIGVLSVVYFVRLAAFSRQVSMDIYDFIHLLYLFLPEMIFYTLPMVFIIAVVSTLVSLSREDELTALFSFGFSSSRLLWILAVPTFLFTVLLLIISVVQVPNNTLKFDMFKAQKRVEAKLIVRPNQVKQRFGRYSLFFEKDKNGTFGDMVLFTKEGDTKILLMANSGKMEQSDGNFALKLSNGTSSIFGKDTLKEIYFETMSIYGPPLSVQKRTKKQWTFATLTQNSKEMSWFTYYIFLSLSPMIVLPFLIYFSIHLSGREQRKYPHLISLVAILVVYTIASYLMKSGTASMLLIVVGAAFATGSYFSYRLFRRY